jgi:integrase
MERQNFYIYKRRRGKQPAIFYVQFRGGDGALGAAISTQQTTKAAATTWVANYLAKLTDKHLPGGRGTFAEFSAGWWTKDCPYCNWRRAHGFHISDAYMDFRRRDLDLHVLPFLGDKKLADITSDMIDDWAMAWYNSETSAPATINRSISTIKVMLAWAARKKLIQGSPAQAVDKLKEEPKKRGILTLPELHALFDEDRASEIWANPYHRTINLLACWTGARLGECQGLERQYVHPNYIQIMNAWSGPKYKLTIPKWKSIRAVPIPSKVSLALTAIMDESPYKEDEALVFAAGDSDKPLSKTAILEQYKRALTKIGITPANQKARTLVFHSWRHGWNSLFRGQVEDAMVRRILGHKTEQMTTNYDNPGIELLLPVLEAQERLFGDAK